MMIYKNPTYFILLSHDYIFKEYNLSNWTKNIKLTFFDKNKTSPCPIRRKVQIWTDPFCLSYQSLSMSALNLMYLILLYKGMMTLHSSFLMKFVQKMTMFYFQDYLQHLMIFMDNFNVFLLLYFICKQVLQYFN